MAAQIRDKRTADKRWFDIDCSDLLLPAETITGTPVVTADQGGCTFGQPQVNAAPITYPDTGLTAAIGKVVQIEIDGGVIPPGQVELNCTIRALVATTLNPAVEATVVLRLVDDPTL